jgi:hypothetical protein
MSREMKKKIKWLVFIIFFIFLLAYLSQVSWLIYQKPEVKGKIIDAESKEPIEGVVVSAYYEVNTYDIAGGGTRVIHTKETLTDVDGVFTIPAYTTIFSPFSTAHEVGMIIYKPGYGSYPGGVRICAIPEVYFSIERSGSKGECFVDGISYPFTYGLVELPKLKTRQERLRALPSHPSECGINDFPLLFKLMNEEHKKFGLKEVY